MKKIQLNNLSPKTLALLLVIIASSLMLLGVLPAPGDGERDLVVRSFSPQGLVPGKTELTLVFSNPVVSEKETGVFLSEDLLPLQIKPPLRGRGKWVNPSTFVYTPTGGMIAPATLYSVSVNRVRDVDGKALSGNPSFEFHSPGLEFKGAHQVDFNLSRQRVEYELEFSLPVSPFRLRGFLEFKNSRQELLAYTASTGPPSTKIRVSLSAGNNEMITMNIAEGLTAETGPLGLKKKAQVALKASLKMMIQEAFPLIDIGSGKILVHTSAPMDMKTAASFLELRPATPFSLEPTEDGFFILGDFNPRDRLTVKILKGFPSLGGGALQEEWEQAFIFPDREATIRFASKGRVLSPQGNLMLPIETVNVESLGISIWRLFDNNIPIAMRGRWGSFESDLAESLASKSYHIRGKHNEVIRRSLNLKPLIGEKKGVFLVTAESEGSNYRSYNSSNQLINITDLGLTGKISATGALFWVNSVSSGKPVGGAHVSLWSRSNQLLAEGTTNSKGIFQVDNKDPWDQESPPLVATVSAKDDVSFLRLDNSLWSYSNFDIGGRPYTQESYEAFCYMPRNIYRPGEKASFSVLVRDAKLNPPTPFPVTLRILSSMGKEWGKKSLLLSKEGSAQHSLTLPHAAPTGSWTVEVLLPGNSVPIGSTHFYVEDFAPPRIVVTSSSKEKFLTPGESGSLSFNARYLFDAPAAELPYEVTLIPFPRSYTHPNWNQFVFGDAQIQMESESTLIANGTLSDQGEGETTIKTRNWRPPSMLDLQLRIGVMEDSGRWVYKTHSIPYYPTATMVGIEAPVDVITAKKKTPIRVASVKPDGTASKTETVQAVLSKIIYRTLVSDQGNENGIHSRVQSEFIEIERREIPLKEGIGTSEFTFPNGGQYIFHVADLQGGGTASTQFYAYDPNSISNAEEEEGVSQQLDIALNNSKYKVGDTVTAKITPPYEGSVLFTVETDKIVHKEVRQVTKTPAEFSFKIHEEMLPNAWITATLIRPVKPEPIWNSHRAFGVVALEIDNMPSQLEVHVQSESKLKPSAQNNFSITLKDAKGRACAGEVTLMLVDEGVHSLTNYQSPNPWEFFTARRELGVGFYDIYDALLPIEPLKTPRLHPAGDASAEFKMGEGGDLSPINANRFKNLTLIKMVSVGRSGKADFTFVVPEFSGTARLVAVASAKNLFGMEETRLPVGREITLEPALPKAIAPLDRVDAPIHLFYSGSADVSALVSVATEGPLEIEGKRQYDLKLSPKGKRASLPLILRARDGSGLAKVTYSLKIKGEESKQILELAVRPPYPRISRAGGFVLAANQKEKIKIPMDWFPGSQRGVLLLSAFPQMQLADITRFLIEYPYGCLEQTVSSSWPLLMQGDILREINPSFSSSYKAQIALAGKIGRIQSLQNYDGGFADWSGTFETNAWNSVYTTHFLVVAKERGIRLPENLLRSSLSYVRELIALAPAASKKQTDYSEALTLRAYASYVLALHKEPHLGWMEYLKDRAGELNLSGKNFLAASYALAGRRDTSMKILAGKAISIEGRGTNSNLDSPIKDQATTLLAWTHLTPRDNRTALLASELLTATRKANGLSTQESGFAFLALSHYFLLNPVVKSPPSGFIADSDGKRFSMPHDSHMVSVDLRDMKKQFSVTSEGEGRLYATWTITGIPLRPTKNEDNGLIARVRLENNKKEDILKKGSAIRGEKITGTLTLQAAAGNIRNVVASYILPGGLEIENPRLIMGEEGNATQRVRTELRDDRLILFIDDLQKPLTWNFTLRAVTAGEFQVPPIAAEAMYNPAIRSLFGGGSRLIIK